MAEGGRRELKGRPSPFGMPAVRSYLEARVRRKGLAAAGSSFNAVKLAGEDIVDTRWIPDVVLWLWNRDMDVDV